MFYIHHKHYEATKKKQRTSLLFPHKRYKMTTKKESGCIGSTKHLNKFTIIVHPSRSIFNYQLNDEKKEKL